MAIAFALWHSQEPETYTKNKWRVFYFDKFDFLEIPSLKKSCYAPVLFKKPGSGAEQLLDGSFRELDQAFWIFKIIYLSEKIFSRLILLFKF